MNFFIRRLFLIILTFNILSYADTQTNLPTVDMKYKTFSNMLDNFENTGKIKDYISDLFDKDKNTNKHQKKDEEFTVFYFISTSMPDSSIEDFITSFEKLANSLKDTKITAKIFLKGYPPYYDEKKKMMIKTGPKGIYDYLKRLRSKKISAKNIKIHIHPWAFDYFKLDKVPAYALSY